MCGLPTDAGRRTTSSHYYYMCFRLLKILLILSGNTKTCKKRVALLWLRRTNEFSLQLLLQLENNWLPLGFVFFFYSRARCIPALSKWKNPRGTSEESGAGALFQLRAAGGCTGLLSVIISDWCDKSAGCNLLSLGGPENPPRGEKLQIYCGLETALVLFSKIQSEAKPTKTISNTELNSYFWLKCLIKEDIENFKFLLPEESMKRFKHKKSQFDCVHSA